MHILVTGAEGFMGKNLMASLYEQADARGFSLLPVDINTPTDSLEAACRQADFVYHLAGVNRPKDEAEFAQGNQGFTAYLLALLAEAKRPTVVLSSSIQAALDNPYGRSKRAAEDELLAYGQKTGAAICLYRLPNAFGKWSRPNYNSAVATFCHNIARGLPIQVNDPDAMLRLVYIDDIVAEFLRALDGTPTREGDYCLVQPEHSLTLEELTGHLYHFRDCRDRLDLVDQRDPLVRKLWATYLSFLPQDDFVRKPILHRDERGYFAELLHTDYCGQISTNVSMPHIVKGNHWHHTKHEKFIVVAGRGVIRFRRHGNDEVFEYPVDGDMPTVVDIPPGYTHCIENLGDIPMVTLMWASERFDPKHTDTFRLPV